ncbi:MAG: metallophosphoesterase, partial [Nanoarchaeota archaeon]
MNLKEVFSLFLRYNYLPSKELLNSIIKNKVSLDEVEKVLSLSKKLELDGTLSVIDLIKYELLKSQEKEVNWEEIEKVRVFYEKNKGLVHFKTILSFFVNKEKLENYISCVLEKNYRKLNNSCLVSNFLLKEEKKDESNLNNEITKEDKKKENKDNKKKIDLLSLFNKDTTFSSDYKFADKIKVNDNIFDKIESNQLEDNEENNYNDENNEETFFEDNYNDLSSLNELNGKENELKKKQTNSPINDSRSELIKLKENKQTIINNKNNEKTNNSENKDKSNEIGSFDQKLIEEIKKKVENLVNNSHFSQNKVEFVDNPLKIIKSFEAKPKHVEVVDFLKYFRSKYKKIKEMLLKRASNLGKELVSIDNLKNNNEYAVIAMIREISQKGDYLVGIMEDLTGEIRFKVNTKEVKEAIELVPDDVALFIGRKKGKTFFIEKIIYPDVPNNSVRWLKDYGVNEDIYAVILSDIHVGSKLFLKKRFTKFIEWLNGKNNKYHGKIGYVIISGDLVDGIGVYPEQIEELEIGSGYEQYKTFAKFLELIPSEINVIVGPGNHD